MSDAYRAPGADLGEPAHQHYAGFKRLPYFLGTLAVQVVAMVLQFSFIGAMDPAAEADSSTMFGGFGLIMLATFAVSIYLTVQRLKNIGAHWAWVFALIVPFLNIYLAWRCLACPEGYVDHKQLDTAGKVVTGLFIGVFVLGIAAAVLVPAMVG